MLIDGKLTSSAGILKSDVVVVGGGTLGLYLATQLSSRGKAVLVVESGGRTIETASNSLTAQAVGRPHNGIKFGRGRGLGGTSVLWGGQLAEFDAADLKRPGAVWPIGYEDLRKWYTETYRQLGLKPPPTAPSLAQVEEEHPTQAEIEQPIERFFTTWLPEPNFARLYKADLTASRKIRVLLNTTVNNIHFDGERAIAVVAQQRGGEQVRLEASKFVLACGTLEANRLMLHLKSHANTPWKANERVGRCFQDHLGGRVAFVRLHDEKKFRNLFENRFFGGIKLQPKLRWRHTARTEERIGVAGLFSFDSAVGENVANLKRLARSLRSGVEFSAIQSLPADLSRLGRILLPIVNHYIRERRIFALFDRGLEFHVQAEQIPIDQSRITLSDQALLADGMPAVRLDWQVDGAELAQLRDFVVATDEALRTAGIGELEIEEPLLALDSAFLSTLSDTYHACGGLCMSSTPTTGVVDEDCRVWGTLNLYVAGSAVFPSSSHANSTFTALALATRLAHHL